MTRKKPASLSFKDITALTRAMTLVTQENPNKTTYTMAELKELLPARFTNVTPFTLRSVAEEFGITTTSARTSSSSQKGVALHNNVRRLAKAVEEMATELDFKFQDPAMLDAIKAIASNNLRGKPHHEHNQDEDDPRPEDPNQQGTS